MADNEAVSSDERIMTSIFERYLTLWVGLCILGGILLGRLAPGRNARRYGDLRE